VKLTLGNCVVGVKRRGRSVKGKKAMGDPIFKKALAVKHQEGTQGVPRKSTGEGAF